ncbi:ubiquitin-conjugating enzyme E2 U isoform X17 [Canis lupus familiaris]|uniref:ubiquitin-conjugating enzyme E2 U isoform X17 n=1 Tax=Canis lupus familiaris TaxID=9615 RepID=UPI0018F6F088|nr:ubiquitin-conjugating enzyme E2 U isoform X17 [Canis lupus familiaris]XP_038521884.1 ubiquitin-conjugating enzyme E2 U isoform X17 [Canis lupus familiaris]
MHCRAYFLLERDFQELKENNFKGITAFPVSEDLMEWGANIEGLQNTFWHGLFFQLTIHFTSQYNFVPPVVKFITIPFHPNVDQNSGRVCIDFLDDPEKWNTNYTLSSILLALQVMLSNPVLENPVNLEAARMLIKDESLYKQIVLRLFSQPIQLLEDPNFIGEYYKQKKVELKHTKEWNLKYAAAVAGLARESRRLSKANYPTERNQLCPTPISVRPESRYGVAGSSAWHPISYDQVEIFADTQTEMDSVMKTGRTKERWKSVALPDGGNESESWEEEVEDLVTWTNTLNTNILED